MDEQQVVELMRSSKSEAEWGQNCDHVKKACGGYPAFWYGAIVLSGLLAETRRAWSTTMAGSDSIVISPAC